MLWLYLNPPSKKNFSPRKKKTKKIKKILFSFSFVFFKCNHHFWSKNKLLWKFCKNSTKIGILVTIFLWSNIGKGYDNKFMDTESWTHNPLAPKISLKSVENFLIYCMIFKFATKFPKIWQYRGKMVMTNEHLRT